MQIIKSAPEHTSVLLTEQEGSDLREMIVTQIDTSFAFYIEQYVGMHYSNVHAYLTGKKAISLKNLIKLLSGTPIQVKECITILTLEKNYGEDAQNATFIGIEETLSSHDLDDVNFHLDALANEESQELSALEKLREKQRTSLESLFMEKPEDSST